MNNSIHSPRVRLYARQTGVDILKAYRACKTLDTLNRKATEHRDMLAATGRGIYK